MPCGNSATPKSIKKNGSGESRAGGTGLRGTRALAGRAHPPAGTELPQGRFKQEAEPTNSG